MGVYLAYRVCMMCTLHALHHCTSCTPSAPCLSLLRSHRLSFARFRGAPQRRWYKMPSASTVSGRFAVPVGALRFHRPYFASGDEITLRPQQGGAAPRRALVRGGGTRPCGTRPMADAPLRRRRVRQLDSTSRLEHRRRCVAPIRRHLRPGDLISRRPRRHPQMAAQASMSRTAARVGERRFTLNLPPPANERPSSFFRRR
jgi:hypothetical protein